MQNSAGPVIYGNHCCCIKANMKTCISIFILAALFLAITPHSARATDTQQTKGDTTQPDGQHDFDFAVGTWKTRVRRLLTSLPEPKIRSKAPGTVQRRKVGGGGANS